MNDSPEATVQRFNDCISAGDLEGLGSLMTEDHTFIDEWRVYEDVAENRQRLGV